MKKTEGIHFYINIANLDDVVENEERRTGQLQHTVHAMDTFFSSIEAYGLHHYKNSFVVEKITNSRLHMYVEGNNVTYLFDVVSAVTQYAYILSKCMMEKISKYKTLIPFEMQVGACFGRFYIFDFNSEMSEETTTIGYAANYAAKLQGLSNINMICISQELYDSLDDNQADSFIKKNSNVIKKYNQEYYYESYISDLVTKYNYSKDLDNAVDYAKKTDLQDVIFVNATTQLKFDRLSKTDGKKIVGIPFFADVRNFTKQFDSEDANLDEMAKKTQEILTAMYEVVEERRGVHVQFQGDREMAVFHNYGDYNCVIDAVIAGMKIIDAVKQYGVSVGVGQAIGNLFAGRIGARGSKDNILLGRTVNIADKNEDEYASENQVVITEKMFINLQREDEDLAKIFIKSKNGIYYTEYSYSKYLRMIDQNKLDKSTKEKNYNGAWGIVNG